MKADLETSLDFFYDKNYYQYADEIIAIANQHNLSTCLIEKNINYNIDVNPTRLNIFVDDNSIIEDFSLG